MTTRRDSRMQFGQHLAALGAAALPKVLPATIQGVKAVGAWAHAHPIQAYVLYTLLEHSAITRFTKGMPSPEPSE